MKRIGKSRTTEAMAMDSKAKESGKKIYNLAAGDPNLPLQDTIKNAFKNIDLDATHQYSSSQGLPALRKKIYPASPEGVIIANGAKQLIYMSLKAVTIPGDSVILIGPCWTSYMEICKLLDINYKLVIGNEKTHFIPSIEEIRAHASDKTCAIVLNTPNNPTGAVYSNEYLNSLKQLAIECNCWLISDEIYSDMVYEAPAPSLKGKENVIYISGFSKSYSLTGWRLGYAIADVDVIAQMSAIQSQMSGPPSTLIQNIILNCFDNLTYDFNPYKERINTLCENEFFAKYKPQGGFYFYIPIGCNSTDYCNRMLEKHNICITPGDSYGVKDTIRISIANISLDDLKSIKNVMFESIVDKNLSD